MSDGDASIGPGLTLPGGALRFTFSRSGGPGGQNVNKLSTRATLTVEVAELAALLPADAMDRLRRLAGSRLAADPERIVLHDDSSRSQHANRAAALAKLRELVVASLARPKVRRRTRPSQAARQRRLDAKKRRSILKQQRRA